MLDFVHKKKTIEFWTVTGEVLSQNKYSETHISSSGGGGNIGPRGGQIHAPKIESSTLTNQEVWIKKNDGVEICLQWSGNSVPLREGQRITAMFAKYMGGSYEQGAIVSLVNHTANTYSLLQTGSELNKRFEIERFSTLSTIVSFCIALIVLTYISKIFFKDGLNPLVYFGLLVCSVIVPLVMTAKRCSESESELEKHIENLTQKILQNV